MPRNSSGTYSLPLPPVVPATVIESVWANTTTDDQAQGITDSLDRYGRGGMVAPFRIVDGSASQPALAFTSETGMGLFRETAGVMGVSVAGAKVAQFTNAGLGALAGLSVAGNVDITGIGRVFSAVMTGALSDIFRMRTNVSNAPTTLNLAPNGSGTGSEIAAFSTSNLAVSSVAQIGTDGTTASFKSFATGAAAVLPMAFNIGGNEVGRVLPAGSWLLGWPSSITNARSANSRLQLSGESSNASGSVTRVETATSGPSLVLNKARGTLAGPLVVADGDSLGSLSFGGFFGSAYQEAAVIETVVAGALGAGGIRSQMNFYAKDAASGSTALSMGVTTTGIIVVGNVQAATFNGAALPSGADALPLANNTTASIGTSPQFAREDHKHPVSSLGEAGQSWQAVVRNASQTYTNDTGRPIEIWIHCTLSVTYAYLQITISGITMFGTATASSAYTSLQAIIPPGATYNWSTTSAASVSSLTVRELR